MLYPLLGERYTPHMIARSQLSEWADRIARQFTPEKIILFGSHAYGDPDEDSDVDLLVVMPHSEPSVQVAADIRMMLPYDRAVDVMVRTPEQVRARLQMNDFFMQEVMSKGHVLYAAGDKRVG